MAVPSYVTNLALVANANALTSDPGTWAELTGHTDGGTATAETDYYIHGTGCVSQSTGSKTGTTCGLQYDYGSNITWSTGYCIFAWMVFLAANAVETWANEGICLGIGSTSGNMRFWDAVGKDFGRNPYGGWQNVAVDPTFSSGDRADDGTPVAANYRVIGSLPNIVSAVSKGNPHAMDVIRAGRGDIVVTAGSLADGYATFAGMASTNDSINNRWGLFSEQMGSYLWKGLMNLGTDAAAVSFVDSNRTIVIDSCPRTYASFNRIEVRHADSVVNWSNISFKSLLGPGGAATLTPGEFEAVADADIDWDGCSFQDMATFIFKADSTITGCIFKNCGLITSGGGVFTGTKVLTSTVAADASAFGWNSASNPDGYLDNMTFTKGTNAHHAINFGTSAATTITLRGMTFTGFNASNEQNDSVLYISNTTDTITIQCVECTGTVSYKRAGSNTVNVTQGVVTKVTVKDIDTNEAIEGARVLVSVADDANFPYLDSVTVSGIVDTYYAMVVHTGHGLTTGDNVIIRGAEPDMYNGVFPIVASGVNAYNYLTNDAISSAPATGTITATLALISDTTDIDGVVSDQRTMAADQPITGWARMSSASPFYRQQPIADTVDSATGKDITVLLMKDE